MADELKSVSKVSVPVVAKYNSKLSKKGVIVFGVPHDGAEKRLTISVVIQRKSDGKFLLVFWKKFGWVAPVVGGIDDGESPEQAAEREVFEETGFKVKAVKKLGGLIESHFFAENKNVWRHRIDQPVLLELVDETPSSVSDDEKQRQEVIWATSDEALKRMTHPDNTIGIRRYIGAKELP